MLTTFYCTILKRKLVVIIVYRCCDNYWLLRSVPEFIAFIFALYMLHLGCMVVWWLEPSPHSKRVSGSIPSWGLSVWSRFYPGTPASSHHPKTCMLGPLVTLN